MLAMSQLNKTQQKNPPKNQPRQTNQKNPHKSNNKEKNHASFSSFKKAPQKLLSGKQDPEKSNAAKERMNSPLERKTKLFSSPFP